MNTPDPSHLLAQTRAAWWHRCSGRARGFSLAEAVVCVFLVSLALVAGLNAVGASAAAQRSLSEQATAMALARELMSEIRQMRYADPVVAAPLFGPEPDETRATFNDVDDFDNWLENTVQWADGTPIPGFAGWKRRVRVEWVMAADPTHVSNTDQGLKRITVLVVSPTNRTTTLVALRSAYDAYEHVPNSQVTYTNWVGVSLQLGASGGDRSTQSVNTINLVP